MKLSETVTVFSYICTQIGKLLQAQLDAEADRLWDEGILNQEKLDAIRQEDLHAK